MNIDNIRKTIESLKASKTFDQAHFLHSCGTPACIAGHAAADAGISYKRVPSSNYFNVAATIKTAAAHWFGIYPDSKEADKLFFTISPNNIATTKEEAIAVLENFIETGRVEWEREETEETT